ncbi:MAG: DUF4115 domain-containing protein [Deltaproteobacteria bacterium]|nr:DUF4115 domain-containing protein [Deltaproteobacteria bacterium]
MDRDEDQPIDIETEGWDISSDGELGTLLKSHREKAGLTLDQLSEQTRVRARFLDALENEAWDRLPSPGFVKGFIRNYARAVGLDPDGVLALYEPTHFPREEGFEPHQAMAPAKSRKPVVWLITLIVLAVAGGCFYYAWQFYAPRSPDSIRTPPESLDSENKAEPREMEDVMVDEKTREEALTEAKTDPPADLTPGSAPTLDAPSSADAGRMTPATDSNLEKKDALKVVETPIETTDKDLSPDQAGEKTSAPDTTNVLNHTLRAMVKERTWIRIFVDDREPKEYVFQPGSQPQWEAAEGFELLIGNAGGIDLDFNGEQMTDLGESGKVIRVFLPEEFKQNRKEN